MNRPCVVIIIIIFTVCLLCGADQEPQQQTQQKQQQQQTQQQQKQQQQQQCTFIMSGNFNSCRHQPSEPTNTTTYCKNNVICRKVFNISYINVMPYSKDKHLIETMLSFCCGTCAELRTVETFSDSSKVTSKSLASSDFVYPFLGTTHSKKMYGFYFVPIVEAPQAYYITMTRNSPRIVLLRLVESIMELWPLVIMTILLSAVSGSAVWWADTWVNEDQFPRPFFVGVMEGFWWAFVSMTTVGYGDKAPKSFIARMLAVLWILTGITIWSICTASLTTAVKASLEVQRPEMAGKQVGWLKNRVYEAALIAEKRGRLLGVESDDHDLGIKTLFNKLANGDVDGILLDVYVYNDFRLNLLNSRKISNDSYTQSMYDLVFTRTFPTPVSRESSSVSYGMLIRTFQDAWYFRKYIADNKMYQQTCRKLQLNLVQDAIESHALNIFAVEAGVFVPTVTAIVIILGCVILFGIVFEIVRWNWELC